MSPAGSFQVYGLCTEAEAEANISLSGKIYWSDHNSPSPQGPFNSIYDANQDHIRVFKSRKHDSFELMPSASLPIVPKTENLVVKDNTINFADFKSKRNRPK